MASALVQGSMRVARTTLRERTLEILRRAILNQEFSPGQRLTERELCELTGVSRSCVREAIRGLESEHLVTNTPHKGPVVAKLSIEEAMQIYEVRAALESLAGEKFAREATRAQLSMLSHSVEQYSEAIKSTHIGDVLATLDNFYEILFEGAGNRVAADVNRSLRARVRYLRATTARHHTTRDTTRSVSSFRRIVRAARARDPQEAAQACTSQVEQAATIAKRILIALESQSEQARLNHSPAKTTSRRRQRC